MTRYRARISGPLLDRIDLYVDVPSVDVGELRSRGAAESSATVRERVIRARQHRASGHPLPLTDEAESLLMQASRRMALSARGISRCVGVARTIAALAGDGRTGRDAVSEALQFRVPATSGAETGNDDVLEAAQRRASEVEGTAAVRNLRPASGLQRPRCRNEGTQVP